MATSSRPAWRTSTFTDNGASCVEVAPGPGAVRVRDTKDRGRGPELVLHPDAFAALCAAATGHPATGHPATGHPATGHPATGHPATGHPATGHPAAGHPAAGHPAAGDLTVTPGERVTRHDGRTVTTHWHVSAAGVTLHYTDAEWCAFAAGVRAGEFAFEPA